MQYYNLRFCHCKTVGKTLLSLYEKRKGLFSNSILKILQFSNFLNKKAQESQLSLHFSQILTLAIKLHIDHTFTNHKEFLLAFDSNIEILHLKMFKLVQQVVSMRFQVTGF